MTLPSDLRLSNWVNKTVYFHDTPGSITTDPIGTGAGAMAESFGIARLAASSTTAILIS